MKKIIFALIIMLAAIGANAQSFLQPGQRTRENPQVTAKDVLENMKKYPDILESALKTPWVKSEIKVYDFSESLPANDLQRLMKRCNKFIKDNNVDVMVAFVYEPSWTETKDRNFNEDLYDYNDFGIGPQYSGIRLVINLGTHAFSFLDVGVLDERKIAFNNYYDLQNAMIPYFRKEEYADGVISYIDLYDKLMNSGKLKTTGYDFNKPEPRSMENLLLPTRKTEEQVRGNDSLLKIVMQTPAVDANYSIYDFKYKCVGDELAKAQQRARKFEQKNNAELALFIFGEAENRSKWTQFDVTETLKNLYRYNEFGMRRNQRACVYIATYDAYDNISSSICFGEAENIFDSTRFAHYHRILKKFEAEKMAPHAIDMIDCFLNNTPMVMDGISLEERIDIATKNQNRLIDISGLLNPEEINEINEVCEKISEEGHREFYTTFIYAPTFKEKDLKYLAKQVMEKCKGEKICMLVINEYNRSYFFIDEDETRSVTDADALSDIYPFEESTGRYIINHDQMKHLLTRYHYHSMTVNERAAAYPWSAPLTLCCILPFAGLLSYLLVVILKDRKYGVKKQKLGARRYLREGSYKVTRNQVTKGESTVSKVYVPPSTSHSSSHSSGSRGSYRGSSGRSSSGGSGRW